MYNPCLDLLLAGGWVLLRRNIYVGWVEIGTLGTPT